MRGARVLAGLAAILFAVACTPETKTDTRPSPPQVGDAPLPVPLTGPEPPALTVEEIDARLPDPGDGAGITEQILHDMRRQTLRNVGVWAKTSGSCEGGQIIPKTGSTTRCTVTYAGEAATWNAVIQSNESSSMLVFYDIMPREGVLTGTAVRRLYWDGNHADHDQLRCSELPDVEVVELHTDTGYRCQYRETASDGRPHWYTSAVQVGGKGTILFTAIE